MDKACDMCHLTSMDDPSTDTEEFDIAVRSHDGTTEFQVEFNICQRCLAMVFPTDKRNE